MRPALAAALALAGMLGAAAPVEASGPFFAEAAFDRQYGEGGSTEALVRGDLGILMPAIGTWRLYVAYRYLSGAPLSAVEQRRVLERWQTRLAGVDSPWAATAAAIGEWNAARATVPGAGPPPRIEPFRATAAYAFYLNCLPDAFRRASATLRRRVAATGAQDRRVRDWVAGQDTVFANCGGGATIPPALPPDSPREARADRAYQIAAAHLYAERLDEAARLFRAIAADPASEWRTLAAYLVVRAEIRRATLAPPADRPALLAGGERELEDLLARPDLGPLRATAEALVSFFRARRDPKGRAGALARALARPRTDDGFRQDFEDYVDLLAGLGGADDHEMTRWIVSFGRAADSGALDRWRAGGGLAWLVAALAAALPGHPATAELLRAASQVAAGSPGEPTVGVHQIRLLVGAGRVDEARALAESAGRRGGPFAEAATRNLLRAWRLRLARSLAELVELAPREVVAVSLGVGEWHNPVPGESPLVILDADAARTMSERLPASMLVEIARAPALPDLVRLHVAQAAWTRAALLQDEATAIKAIRAMPASAPAPFRVDLAAYESARAGAERAFVGALVMLRWPGVRPYVVGGLSRLVPAVPAQRISAGGLHEINDYRQNWWCALAPRPPDAPWLRDYYQAGVTPRGGLALVQPGPPESPAFLTGPERRAAATEWAALRALPTAPNRLTAQVLRWARAHPADARVPEALHLAVRSTRYGCVDGATRALSRTAFQLLHARYPDSPWARKTRYWY